MLATRVGTSRCRVRAQADVLTYSGKFEPLLPPREREDPCSAKGDCGSPPWCYTSTHGLLRSRWLRVPATNAAPQARAREAIYWSSGGARQLGLRDAPDPCATRAHEH